MTEDSRLQAGKIRILVVDDNEMSRRVLEFPLRREGHTVSYAESGRQAIESLADEPVDLVFLDLLMEDMDGREVLEALQTDDKLRDIPVVIVSGIEDANAADECIAAGAREFIFKPATAAILKEIIGNLHRDVTHPVSSGNEVAHTIADAPVLDPNSIEQLQADYDDTVTAGFIKRFQELSFDQKAALEEAAHCGECDDMLRAAHDLKGGARTLGLRRLAAASYGIERACAEGRVSDAQHAAVELLAYFDEAHIALKSFVRSRGLEI